MSRIVAFSLLLLLSKSSFGQQDTLIYELRSKFDQNIGYSFMDYVHSLTPSIRNQVDSVFHLYDFSGKEYNCQYMLTYYVEFDSCGAIVYGETGKRDVYHGELKQFQQDVLNIIVNSKERIRNKIVLSDSIYQFMAGLFSFEISCDPDEVIFNIYEDEVSFANRKLMYKKEDDEIVFDGFKYGCENE